MSIIVVLRDDLIIDQSSLYATLKFGNFSCLYLSICACSILLVVYISFALVNLCESALFSVSGEFFV
jgi:hypothetical protein